MNEDDIYYRLEALAKADMDSDYVFLEAGKTCYGIDKNHYMVYGSESSDPKTFQQSQRTELLLLRTNSHVTIKDGDSETDSTMHLLICRSEEISELKAFIRLTSAFSKGPTSSEDFIRLFTSMTNLFKKKTTADTVSMEGLFGELYAMKYLDGIGKDISSNWQTRSRMKFDFLFEGNKRLDVKTSDSERKHHFSHDQLDTTNYDIVICSVLVRRGNTGVTLADLVRYARDKYSADYDHLEIIENIANRHSEKELESVCYDSTYLESNIKFYRADKIPRYPPGVPDMVSRVNYDSDLTLSKPMTMEELGEWLEGCSSGVFN